MLYLRHLDIDDLIILTSLLQPEPILKNIAKSLGLTPPALTHRINKYRAHIPNFQLMTKNRHTNRPMTPEMMQICSRAKQALDTLINNDKAA